jgi:Alw26I/Eco31I/Esp3I family type II restriction m6 adenine DNA methyltransferase
MPKRKVRDHPELLAMPEVRKLWQTEGLFSDHYLKARLSKNDWWPTDAEARPIWQFCKELYEKRAFALRKYDNEMGVRQEFIDKIIEKIGFAWSDNLRLPESEQELEPDYLLYASAEEKEAVLDKDVSHRYQAAISILEAKKFGHPLSQISRSRQRYPHQQIRDYLNEAQVLTWGILTNGNEWRLYCRDTKPSQFFSINFELAIRSLDEFKFFLVLFSPAAFVRDAQGKCRLDQIRESALATQSELEADLRERIFNIVEILANGFAERPENKITDANLPLLYENCLIFLYRLLFILYAEGRLLLPVEPKSRKYYKQLSLAHLLTPLKNFSEYDSQTQTRFYRDIQALCLVINGTDIKANDEFGVPRYNGGLFDPDHYPLLKEWVVADAVLADVLRQLMFTPEKGGQTFVPFESVDYSDLSVQQLGSIYEGLLEHHFVREGGKLVLQTDKAERKATGTYYTPDYIVKYIVEQTITPLLQEIEQRGLVKAARAAGKEDNSFADEVLKLNICDPAMGSGHFLVEATTFLADEIVYHPTTKFQAALVKGESQEETEIAYWRRRVVESCIYGVDLNPLAVELAKLSLWLTTISSDQPLNFLDHHLRCGNSLIGARVDQLGSLPDRKARTCSSNAPQQIRFVFGPDFRRAVADTIGQIHEIEGEASRDMAIVKAKEKRWEVEILPRLASYKKVADLWTNIFFDGPLSEEEYLAAAKEILVEAQEGAGRLQEAATRYGIKELNKPYFHWELEFPEVFFNDDGTSKTIPGFDAVIGNPPYDVISQKEQQRAVEAEKNFFLNAPDFATAVGNKLNFYRLFIARAVHLLRAEGQHGFIVPMALLGDAQAKGLREHLVNNCRLRLIEAFPQKDDPQNRVFFGAKLSTCLYILQKALPTELVIRVHSGKDILESSPRLEITREDLESFDPDNLNIPCYPNATDADLRLAIKLVARCGGKKLSEWATTQQGEVNLTTDRQFLSDERVGPVVLRGANVGRYFLNDDPKQGEPKYLYVGQFLKARGPDTKANDHKFIRIGYQRGAAIDNWRRIIATIIDAGNYCSDTINYILKPKEVDLFAVLALLSSSLWEWRFRLTSTNNHVNAYEIDGMPFPQFSFTTPKTKRVNYLTKAKQLYQYSLKDGTLDTVLAFVTEQLAAKPERADVVHDMLAFLAEQMTALNKEKRAAAKQFLTDLKDFHEIDAHALKPKTKLDEFWKLEAADVFAHFRANKFRLKDSDEEKIRARFQKAKDALIPLEAQIAFTDQLIDEIVYRLYGLTEAEIEIVEDGMK